MVNDIDKLKDKLVSILNEDLVSIVISNPINKKGASKIKVRPIELKREIGFQFTKYEGTQVFHENLDASEALNAICDYMAVEFKQAQIIAAEETVTVLSNGKGNITMIVRKVKSERKVPLAHNRKKTYILEEGQAVPFLVDLGVMTKDGKIVQKKYDKFRQINRFLEFVEDILSELPNLLGGKFANFFSPKPYINTSKCVGCGECVRSCPMHTIELVEKNGKKQAKINRNKCILCYCCQELCPLVAVDVKQNFLIRLVH